MDTAWLHWRFAFQEPVASLSTRSGNNPVAVDALCE